MPRSQIEVRRALRWLYAARLILAGAIYLAALLVWLEATAAATLIASLAFVASMAFSGGSFLYTEVYHRPAGTTFRYLQSVFDLLLVTVVVYITGGSESQFAAIYILVIASAALLHQPRGVVLVAALGIVLHFSATLLAVDVVVDSALWLQLVLFAAVALGSGLISARLRAESSARAALAAELARFRLREADVHQLRARAERLEAVAELSAALAHEIKNPLAAIRSATEQLALAPPRGNEEDQRALAELATRESDRLSRLLTEFLDFSRPEPAERRTLDIRDTVRDVVQLAESHPDSRQGIAVVLLLADRPLLVDGEADTLHRALFNLVLNAIQVSPEGGVVLVEAEELSPRQTPVGEVAFLRGSVAVRISDQGPGIPAGLLDRVFDPFFTTRERGTGLGLAIVQRAVTAHGGHVVVDSSEGGARFTILLPRSTMAGEVRRSRHA